VNQKKQREIATVPQPLAGACWSVLQKHLARLREVGAHDNRVLHYDQVLATHLMGFYDAAVRSLRTLDARSCSDQTTRESIDGLRVARSTMSDAMANLPAEALLPLMRELLQRLPDNCSHPDLADLVTLKRRIVAIDGSYFRVPGDVLWALAHRRSNGQIGRQIRLDLHLDVLRFLPIKCQVDGEKNASESAAFGGTIDSGVIYLADRNFVDFEFLRKIIDGKSDFVTRLKKAGAGPNLVVVEDRPITEKDKAAAVVSDQLVKIPGSSGAPGFAEQLFRVVTVFDPVAKQEVRLLTTLLDVPAELIGTLYRHRWSIELFFRWLKCVAKVRHLFSESENGITMQFYVMIIATLIAYLHTGEKPSIYTFVLMSSAANGTLVLEKVPEVMERINRERELERVRRQKKKTT
jgi:hypothetical protein